MGSKSTRTKGKSAEKPTQVANTDDPKNSSQPEAELEPKPDTETKYEPAAESKPESDHNNSSDASSDSSGSEDEAEVDITERKDIPESLRSQVDLLRTLREKLAESSQENKREIYKEHQKQHENPGEQRRHERKRREAEILQKRDEYTGKDYERSRFWDYSVERVEKYQEKKRKAEENIERGFTDFAQMNRRKYERDVAKIKPDLAAYERDKAESSKSSLGALGNEHKPDAHRVELLAKSVEEQQRKRAKLHKPSIEKEGEDVSYINDRNARFNRRMNRAYDKHTKEIRDSLERGTAL
ncbi:pre-mRNA-splicing factor SYF2 [Coemansia sp. Benny D115]|nr:pre-mRNA-splicing factor SYF2 [Coemansia sp. Benny D115]